MILSFKLLMVSQQETVPAWARQMNHLWVG